MKKKNQKSRRNKNKFFKKRLCTKEDNSSSDEDEDSDTDTEREIFMEVEYSKEYYEEEVEVDIREKLINSLEYRKNERKKINSLKEELKRKEGSQNHNSEEVEHMITKLKI
jgi:hypothetical protein